MNNNVRRPKQDRGIQTKNDIINAATKLFSERGYNKTNTKEIARAAGVSVGCFYSYFADKKAAFMECLKIYVDNYNCLLQQELGKLSVQNPANTEMIRHLILLAIRAHNMFTEFHQEMLSGGISDPDITRFLAENEKQNMRAIHNYLLLLKDRLRVTDLEAASVIVFKSTQAVVDAIVFIEMDADKDSIIEELTDMLVRYLFFERQVE